MKRSGVYDYTEWNVDLDVMDDVVFLADPPEFVLPEWDRLDEVDLRETHDWTMDYDYPDDWDAQDPYDIEYYR